MGKIITINNAKGGVGKTTITYGLAHYLAETGKKVLAIDGDGQHNLTMAMIPDDLQGGDRTICTAIKEISKGAPKASLPIIHVKDNLDLVPSSIEKARVDLDLAHCRIPRGVLAMLISPIRDLYDYIIIDCAPGLGLFSINVFVASDYIFVPAFLEDNSYQGAVELVGFLRSEVSKHNPSLKFGGIIINKYSLHARLCRDVYDNLQRTFKGHILHTRIRENNVMAIAQRNHVSFADIYSKSNAAVDIESLAKEIMGIVDDSGLREISIKPGESVKISNGKITITQS